MKSDIQDIIKKLREYEVRIRKAVNLHMQGSFNSIFKGNGLEFDDIRMYQYGDDVRNIDWNVTAKGSGTYVKTFKEEKEQQVLFLLDVSASQEIGKHKQQKIDVSKEVVGVLTMSALKEGSSVGLMCFSDKTEKIVRAGKGNKQAYLLIHQMYQLEPNSSKTDMRKAIIAALNLLKKRTLVILVSDFISKEYEKELRILAAKHDVVAIHMVDNIETQMPSLGIIPIYDKESKRMIWVNSNNNSSSNVLLKQQKLTSQRIELLCQKNNINYLKLNTKDDYVKQLIALFKRRNRSAQKK